MDKQIKYTTFDFEFSNAFSGTKNESYSYVKLPYENHPGPKVLFVLDYMPSEDLRTGRLLSGVTGDVLGMLVNLAQKMHLRKQVQFSWLAVTYNAYRTAGKPKEYQQQARDEFTRRIRSLIAKYKPDVVVGFGRSVIYSMAQKQVDLSYGNYTNWLGVPLPIKVGKHTCKFVGTLSLNPLSDARSSDAALIGYMAKNLANAIANEHRFALDAKRISAHKTVLIDTISKFDKLMDNLARQPKVAIDTEADNLNRIANRLLIIQFAKCQDYGYVVPVLHKDSPFTVGEIKRIRTRLRRYFEGENDNQYHIFANAQFDLNLTRAQLGARYMATNVWDIFGGEYAFDENYKFLQNATGDGYYSLGNLALQYGVTDYLTGEFGKEDRSNIANTDLSGGFLRYCSLDVVVPFGIHEQQLAQAEHIKHAGYETLVGNQISDMIHVFSRMENTGSGLDVRYLFHLKTPGSPIEATINKMEGQFTALDAVKKANQRLVKKQGIPTEGLFGSQEAQVFSLRKDEHKQLLFFDVLKLAPLGTGATGNGKLDKDFQTHYKDVPEVKLYTELGKAKKLKNAFVNSFIKLLGRSADLKVDHRIRPSYNYLKVVTGRTSCNNPNLQQIPSRSELGKNIKRLFIARVGCLYVKVDYRVHEVRGWGLISFDKGVAELFKAAKAIRDSYRLKPTPELAKRLKLEADIHIMNAAYFFGVPVDKVDKPLRNDVKGVIFGLIYQMSIKTLAVVLGRELDFTKKLVANFTRRFPAGMKWIEDAKKLARKTFFYENPIGFRRHLWGYCLPDSVPTSNKIKADMDRRAVNSPIQGMCAQFMSIGARALDTKIFHILKDEGRKVDVQIENSVHDSLENTSAYENILESVGLIEESLTTTVREEVFRRHGFKFVVDLEIDFEVGPDLSHCEAWDFSLLALERICYESLVFQRDELKHPGLDVEAAMKKIFVDGWVKAPKWMKLQAKNIGWKYNYKNIVRRLQAEKQAAAAAKAALPSAAAATPVAGKEKVKQKTS